MNNYKLTIEYDGKDFKGWQRQKYTDETIQGKIETSIEKVLKENITLYGAGRTDAGVHALNQIANFKCKKEIDVDKFKYSLNSILPGSITIKKISIVPDTFHARYSARKREYSYKVVCHKISIDKDKFYKFNHRLDYDKVDSFISYIVKQNFFKSFCKNKEDKSSFRCHIFDFKYKLIKSKGEIIFTISADRFLHSMVRAIIGCTLDIGRGKLDLRRIKEKIKKGEKISLHYLPASALFLNKIYY